MTSDQQDETLAQAMDWLLRLNAAPQDEALRVEHDAWLAQDSAHLRAWERAQKGWAVIGLGQPATAEAWPDRRTSAAIHPLPKRRARPAWYLAAAAIVLLLVSPMLISQFGADYAASTGQIRQVRLDDGSTVQLAPDSAINVGYSGSQRRIDLLRGKAFFDVAKDTDRAFVVAAGEARVTVLGTAFDVQIDAKGLSVSVARGAVGVQTKPAAPSEKLMPGERLAVNAATGAAVRQQVAADDIATWREGRLFVADAAIADVVAELRPYSRGWIVIADDDLAALRVNGLYDLKNPEASLRALMASAKGQVRQVGPFLTILGKP